MGYSGQGQPTGDHQAPQSQQLSTPGQQSPYPPINYSTPPVTSSGSAPTISTYIPPVASPYDPPSERQDRGDHPPSSIHQVQRPTPYLPAAPDHRETSSGIPVPQTPTTSVPMSFHLHHSAQQSHSSPAPPSPVGGGTPHPDLEHDLPAELLQQGWRKFWSKRENRIYFWNKASGESLWEMPPLRPNVCSIFLNFLFIP